MCLIKLCAVVYWFHLGSRSSSVAGRGAGAGSRTWWPWSLTVAGHNAANRGTEASHGRHWRPEQWTKSTWKAPGPGGLVTDSIWDAEFHFTLKREDTWKLSTSLLPLPSTLWGVTWPSSSKSPQIGPTVGPQPENRLWISKTACRKKSSIPSSPCKLVTLQYWAKTVNWKPRHSGISVLFKRQANRCIDHQLWVALGIHPVRKVKPGCDLQHYHLGYKMLQENSIQRLAGRSSSWLLLLTNKVS